MFAGRVGFYKQPAAAIKEYMAVGGFNNGIILYTTNPTTWSTKRTAANETYADVIFAAGLWIVVGYDNTTTPIIYTSSDTNTWTLRSNPTGTWTNYRLQGLAVSGSNISVLARNVSTNIITPWTSSDGINWTANTGNNFGQSTAGGLLSPRQSYYDGNYVAAYGTSIPAQYPAYYTSSTPNGSRTETILTTAVNGGINNIKKMSSSLYLASTSGGRIYYSSNGSSWTNSSYTGGSSIWDFAYNGSTTVAVKTGGQIYTSSDGITWTLQTSPFTQTISRVVWDGSVFIACDAAGMIATSTNGTSWTSQTSGTALQLYGLTYK